MSHPLLATGCVRPTPGPAPIRDRSAVRGRRRERTDTPHSRRGVDAAARAEGNFAPAEGNFAPER